MTRVLIVLNSKTANFELEVENWFYFWCKHEQSQEIKKDRQFVDLWSSTEYPLPSTDIISNKMYDPLLSEKLAATRHALHCPALLCFMLLVYFLSFPFTFQFSYSFRQSANNRLFADCPTSHLP
jgi:hypothetical protein